MVASSVNCPPFRSVDSVSSVVNIPRGGEYGGSLVVDASLMRFTTELTENTEG